MGKVILGVFIGIGFLMFIGIIASTRHSSPNVSQVASVSQETAQNRPETIPDISVTAVKLWSDYQANEVAADNAYKGKVLRVTGQIDAISKDVLDDTYLSLASPNQFMEVHANLRNEFLSEAAGLTKGQMILLECQGGGLWAGSPQLKSCSIIHEEQNDSGMNGVNSGSNAKPEVAAVRENARPVYVPSQKVSDLMHQEESLNNQCRGGSGDDALTEEVCAERDAIYEQIKTAGWCWGHAGQIGADKKWEYCGPVAQ